MEMTLRSIADLVAGAGIRAARETGNEPEPALTQPADWPIQCTVGPGLEGAIACESRVGYVNGSKGWLVYRGYDIFELCARADYDEVCWLLLHGVLPNRRELAGFRQKIAAYRHVPGTLRLLMGFPVEKMAPMAALRLGTNLMRQEFTFCDIDPDDGENRRNAEEAGTDWVSLDDDSIAMETPPLGGARAVYEFSPVASSPRMPGSDLQSADGLEACYHLIAGIPTMAAAISRIRRGLMPIDPDPQLSLSANFLYMLTGRRPTELETRIMDICFILHADHGMNASTFACLVVASTLSDLYFSIGAGIGALNGPLHGGANEQVLYMLEDARQSVNVSQFVHDKLQKKEKVVGFGHRVYRAYDPRARVLAPLARLLSQNHAEGQSLFATAEQLEVEMVSRLGETKKIFPNVDFYSGIVYRCLGIPTDLFTCVFAASRVAGWTARTLEYLANNRIFRPRALYIGDFGRTYVPVDER